MQWGIIETAKFKKQFKKLPDDIQKRVRERLYVRIQMYKNITDFANFLTENHKENILRIKEGDHRIICKIENLNKFAIFTIGVVHRKDALK